MSAIEWYFARGNKQMGPVSSADLKRLAAGGEIRPDDLVWREGLTEWAAARSVRGLFNDEGKPVGVEEAPSKPVVALSTDAKPAARARARHLVDVLLDAIRSRFNANFIEATGKLFRACGLYGLLAALVVTAAFTLIVAVKTDPAGRIRGVLSGIVLLLALAALQYVAGKFCDVLDRLNRATGGSLSSTALPDCFALLSLVTGVAALLGSAATAIELSMYWAILSGAALFIVCGYLALVALNPATLSISIVVDEARTGEEAIGAITFLLKALVRLTPVALGTGVICGTLMMGYACYEAFSDDGGLFLLLAAQTTASAASAILISSAALPLAAYLLFLLGSLSLDLCRAILILPGKLAKVLDTDEEKKGGP